MGIEVTKANAPQDQAAKISDEIKQTGNPSLDQGMQAANDQELERFNAALKTKAAERVLPVVDPGDIIVLNLADGRTRPAMVLNVNDDSTLDLCVFFNGPKDYTLTGNTSPTAWYTQVHYGSGEGQWKLRQQ